MKIRVLKFGGTSVANGECMQRVAALVESEVEARGRFPVVIVSAMAGVTDLLFEIACDAAAGRTYGRRLAELRQRHLIAAEQGARASLLQPGLMADLARAFEHLERDLAHLGQAGSEWAHAAVIAWGERLSVLLLAAALRVVGVNAQVVREELIITEAPANFRATHGAAPLSSATGELVQAVLRPLLERGVVPVVPGFIARSVSGEQTLLGRGGSDWTAALVAAALEECDAVSIYTDVRGVLSADPRVVGEAQLLPQLSYSEAAHLAWFGAKILHPQTLDPVARRGIPVYVKSTFAPDSPGTVIGPHQTLGREMGALALRRRLALVSVSSGHLSGSAAYRVPGADTLARAGIIPFAMCASPGNQLSFAVEESLVDSLVTLIQDEVGGAQVACRKALAACTYVGPGMLADLIRAGCALTSLAAADISVEALSITHLGLTLIVREEDAERTLRDLHASLIPTPELVPA